MREQVHLFQPSVTESLANELHVGGMYTDTRGGGGGGRENNGSTNPGGHVYTIKDSNCIKVKGEGQLPHTLESAAMFPFCSFL